MRSVREGRGKSVQAEFQGVGVEHGNGNAECERNSACLRAERASQAGSEGGVCKTARGQVCAKL